MGRKKAVDVGERDDPSPLDRRLIDFVSSRLTGSDRPEDVVRLEQSYHAFLKDAWPVVNPNQQLFDGWYVGCIAEHLQALFTGQIKKLVVAFPPSFGKSVFCAVLFPAWIWTHTPTEKQLYTSYGDDLAVRDSLRCRDVILSPWYQERWGQTFAIKADVNTRDLYANDRGGHRIATTPGGAGTGLKANIIIVDDAHKREEIHTVRREFTVNWWLKTMETRGEVYARTRRGVIGQRLAENDLSGTVLAARELGYESLILPMEWESGRVIYALPPPDPLPRDAILPTSLQRQRPELRDPRTTDGELLCHEIVDRAGVDALKVALMDDAPGQLQQRPSSREGTVFLKATFNYFEVVAHCGVPCVRLGEADDPLSRLVELARCRFFQTFDTASTVKSTSDYTACVTFALTPTFDLLAWHVFRHRLQTLDLYALTRALLVGPVTVVGTLSGRVSFLPAGAPWPSPLLYQAVEEKNSGIGLIQQGVAEGRPFKSLKADADKMMRARAVAWLYQAGKVFHRKGAPWLGTFEDELLGFPNAAHDDQCDCAAYGGVLVTHDKYTRLACARPAAYPAEEERPLRPGVATATDHEGRSFVYARGDDVVEIEFDD